MTKQWTPEEKKALGESGLIQPQIPNWGALLAKLGRMPETEKDALIAASHREHRQQD